MRLNHDTRTFLFSTIGVLIAACAGESPTVSSGPGTANTANQAQEESLYIENADGSMSLANTLPNVPGTTWGTRAHIYPVRSITLARAAKTAASTPSADLVYYGGPIISNVRVFTVFWNSSTQYQSQLNDFYTSVTNSTYFDWLVEYNTPTQQIGRGSFAGSYVDTGAPSKTTVDDTDIQAELARLVDAGKLPKNDDGNLLFAVHFPPGVTITQQGQQSCQVFCAYHSTFQKSGAGSANPNNYYYYSVLPDQGGACAGGCGADSNEFNNLTSVSSHEMIEAVTDGAVGVAETQGPPLAWYDNTNGEIGDICNAVHGTVGQWTVQKEWSNSQGACVTNGPGGTPPPPPPPTGPTGAPTCSPQCQGTTCGSDDGCGGTCQDGSGCTDPTPTCTPQCQGATCGDDDGCGNPCQDGSGCTDGGGPQQCTGEQEPNSSFGQAQGMPLNSCVDGEISTWLDVDYFAVNASPGDTIHLSLTNLDADCDLKLYNAAGHLVQTSSNPGTADEDVVYTAVGTTYYGKVYGWFFAECDYELTYTNQ